MTMSQEAARAFVEKMRTDEAFSAKATAVDDEAERVARRRASGVRGRCR